MSSAALQNILQLCLVAFSQQLLRESEALNVCTITSHKQVCPFPQVSLLKDNLT